MKPESASPRCPCHRRATCRSPLQLFGGEAPMDLTREYRIPAARETVWKALKDREILSPSIPGCEEIRKRSDTEMTAKVTARVGPVKASFSGKVTLSDLDPPNGYKISGEGQGGVAGFARGSADVRLKPDEG